MSKDVYKLQVNQKLRYAKVRDSQAPYNSENLVNFWYLAKFEGQGTLQLESGINTPKELVGSDGVHRRPAILISSSPHKKGTSDTPWQDFFDSDSGYIRYFGDNKHPGQDPAKSKGNKALKLAFQLAHSHEKEQRRLTPPLLFFRRVAHKGKSKGFPEFQGFGVIRSIDLVTQWDNANERAFTNYAFDFTVLSMQSEHEVFDWRWILDRRDPKLTLAEADKRAPLSWKEWVASGANSLDRLRRSVSKLAVVPPEEQRPGDGTDALDVLLEIYRFYDGRKHRFEALAERIAERVVGAESGIYRPGWITAASGDRGIDFVARVRLGSGFSSTDLVVLGQAKCEALDKPTNGVHIARTVARLQRGWLGVYVTTSFFSKQVQQEIIEDKYPIVLIHGKRLALEVLELIHESDEFATVSDFLNKLDQEYESRLKTRRPDERIV